MDSIRSMIKHDGRRSFHFREDFKKMRAAQREARIESGYDTPSDYAIMHLPFKYPVEVDGTPSEEDYEDVDQYDPNQRLAQKRMGRALARPLEATPDNMSAVYDATRGEHKRAYSKYNRDLSIACDMEALKEMPEGYGDRFRVLAEMYDALAEKGFTEEQIAAALSQLNKSDSSPEAPSPEAPSPKEPHPLKATIRYFPDSGHTKIYFQTSSGRIKHIRIADDSWSVKEMDSSAPHHYKVSYRNGRRRYGLPVDKVEYVGFEDDD